MRSSWVPLTKHVSFAPFKPDLAIKYADIRPSLRLFEQTVEENANRHDPSWPITPSKSSETYLEYVVVSAAPTSTNVRQSSITPNLLLHTAYLLAVQIIREVAFQAPSHKWKRRLFWAALDVQELVKDVFPHIHLPVSLERLSNMPSSGTTTKILAWDFHVLSK